MALPIFKSDDKDVMLLQTNWASVINPVVNNPLTNGILLKEVSLATGANVINHRLGRKLQGWILVRIRAASSIYDTQDTNQTPQLTLNLQSSASSVVDLYVF